MNPRNSNLLAIGVMLLGVLAVYVPAPEGDQTTLRASDYHLLHQRRMSFAIQNLLSESPTLPAWYSRELLGTPFRANLQNFPLIPTRLPLLLTPPDDAMAVGTSLAAMLAALFTFLYSRRVGIGPLGAAVAGWTFATSGFFASRVMAGHLPLLEAYPALPLLLWLVERYLATIPEHAHGGRRLATFSAAIAAVLLAGHPQIPAYAIGVTGLYILFRARGNGRWKLLGAIALGACLAAFALVPMALLVRRSTRILALAQAYNDVSLPPWRLWSLLYPWANGWPDHAFPAQDVVFWDTVIYMGLLPLLATAFLGIKCLVQKRRPDSLWIFWIIVGVLAVLTALPFARKIMSLLPGTYLRSPVRQFYVTTMAFSLASALAIESLWNARRLSAVWRYAIVIALLAGNAVDVTIHGRGFVLTTPAARMDPAQRDILAAAGNARVAFDYIIPVAVNREIDDVGFFDSLMLARAYRTMLSLAQLPATTNIQEFSGSTLSPQALAYLGVKYVLSSHPRPDLTRVGGWPAFPLYEVPGPAPRAAFFPTSTAIQLTPDEIQLRLRNPQTLPRNNILLSHAPRLATRPAATASPLPCDWKRDGSDTIKVDVTAPESGYVKVLETADDGWSATVDGAVTPIIIADDTFLAVPVGPGKHAIRFHYTTPGASDGIGISVAALAMLAIMCARRRV